MRLRRSAKALVLCFSAAMVAPLLLTTPASAVCAAPDPNDPPLTLSQMIQQGKTGEQGFPILLLGRVHKVRFPGDSKKSGGLALATLRVRAAIASGHAAAKISFYHLGHDEGAEYDFEFRRGAYYAVVAHHYPPKPFGFDDACGQSRKLSAEKLHQLVRLARSQ